MTQFKFSSLIIGIVLASIVVGVVTLSMTDLASKDSSLSFDNETVAKYNKQTEMIELSANLSQSESELGATSAVDLLGAWLGRGYQSVRLAGTSIDTVSAMADNAADDLNLGKVGIIVSAGIGTIMFIIFIAIILSTLTKREQ